MENLELELDLFAADDASVELLEDSAAAWGTLGTISSAGTVTGCLGSASTVSSNST
ncbi:thiocillin family RiPP [Kitasatospora sp. SUK 42]|uniref:thiocillin family RiPP n=1 Tax=Kitasatospora sp. SUK 42 TaxID=1588882 RepID=UPI0018C940B0|nr:thiocillin family RiPP [Kitasatospora sp. SUK 42]MBV2153700.1 thiocillin family RiPP [Kitasatospora sp. SUK 42]